MVDLEVVELEDGRFAVRSIGGNILEAVNEIFDTKEEADEWMLDRVERGVDGPHTLRPGSGQGPF